MYKEKVKEQITFPVIAGVVAGVFTVCLPIWVDCGMIQYLLIGGMAGCGVWQFLTDWEAKRK